MVLGTVRNARGKVKRKNLQGLRMMYATPVAVKGIDLLNVLVRRPLARKPLLLVPVVRPRSCTWYPIWIRGKNPDFTINRYRLRLFLRVPLVVVLHRINIHRPLTIWARTTILWNHSTLEMTADIRSSTHSKPFHGTIIPLRRTSIGNLNKLHCIHTRNVITMRNTAQPSKFCLRPAPPLSTPPSKKTRSNFLSIKTPFLRHRSLSEICSKRLEGSIRALLFLPLVAAYALIRIPLRETNACLR